jgi:hypothetical protein
MAWNCSSTARFWMLIRRKIFSTNGMRRFRPVRLTAWNLPKIVVTATVPCCTVFTDERISKRTMTARTIPAMVDPLTANML